MIPQPGLLLACKVNDDTIFNRIDQQLKTNPQVISVDTARPQNADDARARPVHRRTPAQHRQQRRLPVHRLHRRAD